MPMSNQNSERFSIDIKTTVLEHLYALVSRVSKLIRVNNVCRNPFLLAEMLHNHVQVCK